MIEKGRKRPSRSARRRAPDAGQEEALGPTPETVAKLRPDPFRLLYTRGQLDPNAYLNALMWDAGLEIRRAYGLVVAPVALWGRDYEREVRRAPWEAAEARAAALARNERLVRRYAGWRRDAGKKGVAAARVIDLVVEGLPCRELDRRYGKRRGWSAEQVRAGLRLYLALAGWAGLSAAA
ncbi:MAG: hypothetical protein EXQ86_09015 [Rhodospirillales bacterium]|nr:hypothetical protein [Rhodospirillales bacterium]